MLKSLITSEARIKLLLKFFLNPDTTAYLRQLSKEFGESTNGIRVELNKLAEAQILETKFEGRNKMFKANLKHPLFEDLRNIVLKSTGIDKVISNIISRMGDIDLAFVRGDYAVGIDNGLIDLVVVGNKINLKELERVRLKTEKLIQRKISIFTLNSEEYLKLKESFVEKPNLILYRSGD